MNTIARRPRSAAAERALWKQRFFQSGLLLREFAEQHGLKLSTLQRWVARSAGATPGGGKKLSSPGASLFEEVTLPLSAAPSRWAAELVRPEGSRLRPAHDVSGALLKQLLRSC